MSKMLPYQSIFATVWFLYEEIPDILLYVIVSKRLSLDLVVVF